jgi:hypothetical protein
VLELDGAQHDSFDISTPWYLPSPTLRVFAIAKRLAQASTLAPGNRAARFPGGCGHPARSRGRIPHRTLLSDPGRHRIEPSKLGKFDRLLLKTAFSSIQRFLEFTVSTFIPES